MAPSGSSTTNPNSFRISTTISIEDIWTVCNEFIFAVCCNDFSGPIKYPGPVLLTELKWDPYNIKVKIFMELMKGWDFKFKIFAAVSGTPKKVETGSSEKVFHVKSFYFDMKIGEKWESDDAQNITLKNYSQDLTEVEFEYGDIRYDSQVEVTILADCQLHPAKRY